MSDEKKEDECNDIDESQSDETDDDPRGATVSSPMFSCSPRFMAMPDLHYREKVLGKEQHKYRKRVLKQKKKEQEEEEKRRQEEEKLLYNLDKRERSVSFGNAIDYHDDFGAKPEEFQALADEDEQWEKKKEINGKKIQKSNSNMSLTPSLASSINLMDAHLVYSPNQVVRELREAFAREKNPFSMSVVYGLINCLILLPVMMSFTSIIYHDKFFQPYMPVLVKLTLVSAAVHQLCFAKFSTLPFAVGQVQDAGLIFLSAMASQIVEDCKQRGCDDETILATVVVGLSIFTFLLGIGLILIGKLRLASLVQKLPTPVIGGYLAFIGFFCGMGGMALMSGVQTSSPFEVYKYFQGDAFIKVLPGLLGGILIYVSVRTLKHMSVLPVCIVGMLVLFFIILDFTGVSVKTARDDGWINQADPAPVWYKTWCYFKFDKVVWETLPSNTPALLSMIVVVALSSGLDIAAIDLEVPKPLEYNYELCTIGWSNIISGLSGGYTGSYIFSQTIFSLRSGIRCRSMGYIIALCEFVFVVIPIPILSYVPNFFFGSLLLMICVDLMVEWLWDVRHKLTNPEYCVTILTFGSILVVGVESGIVVGTLIYFILLKLGMDIRYTTSDQGHGEESRPIFRDDSQSTFQTGLEYGSVNSPSSPTKNDNVHGIYIEDLTNNGFFIEADSHENNN